MSEQRIKALEAETALLWEEARQLRERFSNTWEEMLGVTGATHSMVTLDANADTLLSLAGQELGLDTQAAKLVFIGPASGAPAAPTFRALAYDDLPDIGAAPTFTLGTTSVEGSAPSFVRTDATVPIFDVTVPGAIEPDDAAATGSAAFAARRDHQHSIVCGAPVDIGTSNSEGTSLTDFARADHVHNHPSALGTDLHHAQSHVFATSAGLGADHTTSGLTIGHVLRATGATTAAFGALIATDLPTHTHSGPTDGGSLAIGTTDTDATQGNVFFAGLAGVLQQNSAFFWDDNNQRLGIGVTPAYDFHVGPNATTVAMLGAPTDAVNKSNSWVSTQYAGAETEGYMLIAGYATSAENRVYIGGGYGGHNTATDVIFYTGATTTTRTGAESARIIETGYWGFGTDTPGNSHVVIRDNTLTSTSSFYGLLVDHSKTGGVGGAGDDYTAVGGFQALGHATTIDNQFGGRFQSLLTLGTADQLHGVEATARVDAGTVNIMAEGVRGMADINAGTISGSVRGLTAYVDVESAVTSIGGSIAGLYVEMYADKDPAGSVYVLQLVEGSGNFDYCFYQSGSAPSYFAGDVGIQKAPGYPLDVSGSARIGGAAGTLTAFYLNVNEWMINAHSDGNFYVRHDTGGGTFPDYFVTIQDTTGNFGLNQTNPSYLLTVNDVYGGTTAKTATYILNDWTPSGAPGAVYPAGLSLQSRVDSAYAISGFHSTLRAWAYGDGSVGFTCRLQDLRYENTGTGTVGTVNFIHVRSAANTGGGAISNIAGLLVEDQTVASSTAYGVKLSLSSGSGKYNVYADGTAPNYFAGRVGVGELNPSYPFVVSTTHYITFLGSTSSIYGASVVLRDTGDAVDQKNWYMRSCNTSFQIGRASDIFAFQAAALTITNAENFGVGTDVPDARFDVTDTGTAQSITTLFQLHTTDEHGTDETGTGTAIDFRHHTTASVERIVARIVAINEGSFAGASNNDAGLAFYTIDGSVSTDPAERVRISAEGDFGIGDPDPDIKLTVVESDSATTTLTDVVRIEHQTDGIPGANFGAGILFRLEDTSEVVRDAARLAMVWQSAAAAENAEYQLLLNYNATLYECGVVVAPGAASSTANQRGVGSVDWQGMRTAATQIAVGNYCTIGGGAYNISGSASDHYATVAGGYSNDANADSSTIAGGNNSTVSGDYSAVGGGQDHIISGKWSTIPGGYNNSITTDDSFAAGTNASITHADCFVWSATAATVSWGANTFTARCHGGARFYSAAGTATGVQLSTSGTSWASISDEAIKLNFRRIDHVTILEQIADLPLYWYNLRDQAEDVRHIGPTAQDFNPLFGFTEAERYINNMDYAGVAMAGVQALIAENAALRARVERLERAIN